MKFLRSYKIFESVDEIKSTIEDILRDNILDRDIPLKIHVRNYTTIADNKKFEVIKIQIGDEVEDYGYVINVEDIKQDILTITEYLKEDGSSPYQEWFNSLDTQAAAKVTVAKSRLELGNTSNVKWFDGIGEYKID